MAQSRIGSLYPGTRDPRLTSRILAAGGIWLLFFATLFLGHFLLVRLGVQMFVILLMLLFFGTIYSVISFKSLPFPFYIGLLAIGGFRYIWSIQAPVLPDLYLDRILILFLIVVFMVKFFAEGRRLRGPFALDLLILAHGLFVLLRVYQSGMIFFHLWTMSIMMPYLVYFLAKNIIQKEDEVRKLLLALLLLGVYYSITAIAEKFNINWLLYPKYMIFAHEEFVGRSTGPFRNSGIFGNTIGMLLPINLYFLATTRRLSVKLLLMVNMGLGLAGLYFTYTRGAWVAGFLGISAAAWLNRREYLRILLPLAGVAAVMGMVVLGLAQDQFMKERVENANTIDARVGTLVTALRVWRDHPFVGCGSYSYDRYRDFYIDPVEVPGLGTIRQHQFRYNGAHDMYLSPLAEDGLLGAAFQFSIYLMVGRAFYRKYQLRKQGDHFATYVIPIFVGIFVLYLFGGLTQTFRHVSIMGSLLYMAAGIASGYQPEPDNRPTPRI